MRTSTVVALAVVAATPALSAPVEEIYARQAATVDASGALDTGLIKDGVDIANGVIQGIQGIKNIFDPSSKREEFTELLSRAIEEELVARDVSMDASGAISFGAVKDAFGIGKDIFDGVQGISNLVNGNSQSSKREPFSAAFRPRIGITVGPGLAKAPQLSTRELEAREPLSPLFHPRIGTVVLPQAIARRDEELVARILPSSVANFPTLGAGHFPPVGISRPSTGIRPVSLTQGGLKPATAPSAPQPRVQKRAMMVAAAAPQAGAPSAAAGQMAASGSPSSASGLGGGLTHARPHFRTALMVPSRFQSPPFVGKLPQGSAASMGSAMSMNVPATAGAQAAAPAAGPAVASAPSKRELLSMFARSLDALD
ncbi:hypothetical protein EIP91_010489 [Steccherinum ochraceum]|uniref:Uncharacterized protein n=1 Tax=Steccherinum ochraceum TaxID=92696 RepID=A0A4R0RZB3_9APHY|nr:hypothetical protein EIP91_010489 [Steccherinum ochraceum]